jgi:hypothetical protein
MPEIEHDYDFHGGHHPFIEVEPGLYIRFDRIKRKAWVVDSVKDRGRHTEAECPARALDWQTTIGPM